MKSETDAQATSHHRVLRIAASQGAPRRLVVVLHGVGANAEDMFPLAQALAPALPDAEVLVPDGFHAFEGPGSGRQWFSIRGITEQNRPARVAEAASQVSAWLDAELKARDLGGDQLILIGFSQGAIVSQWLSLHRAPSPTVVSIAGRLAVSGDAPAQGRPRILLIHGTADQVMPISLAEDALSGLRRRGAEVALRQIPGLGHGIDRRVLDEVLRFLTEGSGRNQPRP